MTLSDRIEHYQVRPPFVLQLGSPPDERVSVQLLRTSLDK